MGLATTGEKPALIKRDDWYFADPLFRSVWERVHPHAPTSPQRAYAIYAAVAHLVAHGIEGSFVECGASHDSMAMVVLHTLAALKAKGRELFLFGGPAPSEGSEGRMAASGGDLRQAIKDSGADLRSVRIVPGDIGQALKHTHIGPIALLRLDTDAYDATLAGLDRLYPHVVHRGLTIVDGYGRGQGAGRAFDEYFAREGKTAPFLMPIDFAGRIFVRTEPTRSPAPNRYDYVPPGLVDPNLLAHFPHLQAIDPERIKWPYLRAHAPHRWRVDRRAFSGPAIGVLSVEEAVLVHNLALPFRGKPGLEIGCHLAWSTAHILAAGIDLDVIDPGLGQPRRMAEVSDSLRALPNAGRHWLWAGFSPSIVPAVRSTHQAPWSFVFIDGNHDDDAPRLDAEAVLPFCADNALVAFHDLTSPHVAEGLRFFKEQGWNYRLYNTMQVMGAAWRGAVEPVDYTTDPNMPPLEAEHLKDLL